MQVTRSSNLFGLNQNKHPQPVYQNICEIPEWKEFQNWLYLLMKPHLMDQSRSECGTIGMASEVQSTVVEVQSTMVVLEDCLQQNPIAAKKDGETRAVKRTSRFSKQDLDALRTARCNVRQVRPREKKGLSQIRDDFIVIINTFPIIGYSAMTKQIEKVCNQQRQFCQPLHGLLEFDNISDNRSYLRALVNDLEGINRYILELNEYVEETHIREHLRQGMDDIAIGFNGTSSTNKQFQYMVLQYLFSTKMEELSIIQLLTSSYITFLDHGIRILTAVNANSNKYYLK